ncbi:MAG: hypothetical protein LBE62_02350 [Azonexus sp.]|jgi:hypothetical protein|nr:hypothetical protein [Azonexus sp.]
MSHTVETLREHLFATLEGLRAKDNPLEIERAKAVCEVAQTIINTAKVEVDAMRINGQPGGSAFLAVSQSAAVAKITSTVTKAGVKRIEQHDGYAVTTHKMAG